MFARNLRVTAIQEIRKRSGKSLEAAAEFHDHNPDTWPARLETILLGEHGFREAKIRAAINEYYLALDERQHGGMAESRAFMKIQQILSMHWVQGEQLAKKLT